MNNSEFLDQTIEYIKHEYSDFVEYQGLVWNIFREFDLLTRKNGLIYYMGFGSLIGIIRDKGKIPWDYDIDVIMSIEDREKIINILKEQLDSSYYYTYIDNVGSYPTTCLRICKKGHPFTSIHLDVFFAIGCPDTDTEAFVKTVDRYHELRAVKYGRIWFPRPVNSFYQKIVDRILRIKGFMISPSKLKATEETLWHKYPLSQSKYCSIVGDPYLHFYETEWFREGITFTTDGIDVRVPKGYDLFLRKIYKDYMQYLPIEKRFNEFYSMLNNIRTRQHIMDNSSIYDKFKA